MARRAGACMVDFALCREYAAPLHAFGSSLRSSGHRTSTRPRGSKTCDISGSLRSASPASALFWETYIRRFIRHTEWPTLPTSALHLGTARFSGGEPSFGGPPGAPSVSSVGRTKLLGRVQIIQVNGGQNAGEGRTNTLNTPTSTIGYRGTPTNVVVDHFSCITTRRAHLLPSQPSRRRGLRGGSIGEPSRSQGTFLPRAALGARTDARSSRFGHHADRSYSHDCC